MSVTVSANGLSIVHKDSGGEASATLPDVCLTTVGNAVVPIPYSNTAKSKDLVKGSKTVTADGRNSIAIKGCSFSKSTGDGAGDKKGIISGTVESEAKFISSSPTVKIEGKSVCRLSDQLTMNSSNTLCLGGLIQRSLPRIDDDEGTYTVDISLKYSDGDPVQKAEYLITDSKGKQFKGNLNEKGRASSSGLAPGKYTIEYGEDSRRFILTRQPEDNPKFNKNLEVEELISKSKEGKSGFWEIANYGLGSVDWRWRVGGLGELKYNSVANDVILHAGITVIPNIDQYDDIDFIAKHIMRLGDKNIRKKSNNWNHLILTLFGCIPTLGSGLKSIGKLIDKKGKKINPVTLFAILRKMGKGDPITFLRELKWADCATEALKIFDDIISTCMKVFETLATYANNLGYIILEDMFKSFCSELEHIKNEASNMFSQFANQIQTNLDHSLNKSANGKYAVIKTETTKPVSEYGVRNDIVNEETPTDEKKCWLCQRDINPSAKPSDRKICRGAPIPHLGEYAEKGNSKTLAKNLLSAGWGACIVTKKASGDDYKVHPWCDSRNPSSGNLQAHHAIPSETVCDDKWKRYRSYFKYDVDEAQNGVLLPSATDVACQLGVAVHIGNHNRGLDYTSVLTLINLGQEIPKEIEDKLISLKLTYLEAIKEELKHIAKKFSLYEDCYHESDHENFFNKMRELSTRAVKHIDKFEWTITGFGKDYHPGVPQGCANQETEAKDKKTRNHCKKRKNSPLGNHNLKNAKGQIMMKSLVAKTLVVGK